ncbi:TolC family protein [Undibacterium sp. Di26W]|uniref:TolC family protein n=1 Tax=Undibacterium sp. Di26W TaxID=3413035 RepID=UPI003BF43B13
MKTVLFITSVLSLLFASQSASSQAITPETPGLLPTPVVRALLEQDPSVSATLAGLEAARQEAGLLEASPYEWTAKVTAQRRAVQHESTYREWNAGIERGIRLPGKAAADRKMSKAVLAEAEANYGEALHETARDLLKLWLDWLAAEQALQLASQHRASIQENLAIVEKRVKAGDVARLDLNLAQAELAEQKRSETDARTQAQIAWGRLQARFPNFDRQFNRLPTAVQVRQEASFWRERILGESDELKIAIAQFDKAQAHAERGRAEQTPDPTVGVFTSSEVGGRERVTGISISIPLSLGSVGPQSIRSQRSAKSSHLATMSRHELELRKRQLTADINATIVNAEGYYESQQLAESSLAAAQTNAKLVQRAYALGEVELQALLAARRQATSAAQNALGAKVAASMAYYLLLVDAHLVWDLDHE